MSLYLEGKGLFVFSDPAGAKAILAYVKINNLKDYLIVSDRTYSFFDEFGLDVQMLKPTDAYDTLKEVLPDYVFTATSYTSSLEVTFIDSAKKLGIKTVAFIDHYTRFKDRFMLRLTEVYPDHIALLDQKAYDIANEMGFGAYCQLEVTGNFYYEFLQSWKSYLSRRDFLSKFGLDDRKRTVVYAPEPLSNIEGAIEKFGFDEITATQDLLKAIDGITDQFNFVLTPHPNQKNEALIRMVEGLMTVNSGEIQVNDLIYHSDWVVGFFSNFLIEAQKMGKNVLRYFYGPPVFDPLSGLGVGKVVNDKELIKCLKSK